MQKRCVEVHFITMAATVLSNMEHSRPSQVADETPDRAMSQGEVVCDFVNGAVRVGGHVKQHGTVAGNEIEASDKAPLFQALRKDNTRRPRGITPIA
jgi:hypothetical protein